MHLAATGPALVSFSSDLDNASTGLDLIGVNPNGPAGILAPGAHGTITVYGTTTGAGTASFELSTAAYPPDAIEWSTIGPLIRPSGLTDAAWNAIFAQLQANIGATWDGYQRAISADATLFADPNGLNYSLADVLQLEVNKAYSQANPGVSGVVYLNNTSQPLAGATVRLFDPADVLPAAGAITLADGSFDIPSVAAGTYDVAVDGYILPNDTLTVTASGEIGVQLIAQPGATITGSLAASGTGAPVTGENVYAVSTAGVTVHTTSDGTGAFSFSGLPAGTYSISAGGDGYVQDVVANVVVPTGRRVSNVDLTLATAGSISGTVTGPGGPVAGALVGALGADGATAASATTAADGSYIITGLPAGTYTIDATADGLFGNDVTGIALATGGTVSGVNLTLNTAGSVNGHVVSTVDGSAETDVLLSLTNGAASFSAESDGNGNFTFTDLPAGAYTLATIPGTVMTTTTSVTVTAGVTTTVTLHAAPIGQVTGTVTNGAGQPVSGVTVFADQAGNTVTSTVTGSNGAYELTGLDAGTYQIAIGDPGSAALVASNVTLGPANIAPTVNLSLPVAGTVSGTVFAANGVTPLSGAVVALSRNGADLETTSSDGNGNYSFVIETPGTYTVEAASTGLAFPVATGLAISGASALTGINFHPGSAQLDGVVDDTATGKPISGATVSVVNETAGLTLTGVGTITTAADGTFQLANLLPCSYAVLAQAAGHAFASQTVTVTAGAPAQATFKLGTQSVLEGFVLDASGNPIVGAALTLTSNTVASFEVAAQSNASGAYSFAGLASGSYTLVVAASGYETAILGTLNVGAGSNGQSVGLNPANIQVSGTVTGPAGPLGQVEVTAYDGNNNVAARTVTAADGTYTLETLAPGTYSVVAAASGYAPSAASTLTVTAGQSLSGVTLSVVPAAAADPPPAVTPLASGSGNPILAQFQVLPDRLSDVDTLEARMLNNPCSNPDTQAKIADLRLAQDQALRAWQLDFNRINQLGIPQKAAQIQKNLDSSASTVAALFSKLSDIVNSTNSSDLGGAGMTTIYSDKYPTLIPLLQSVGAAFNGLENAIKFEDNAGSAAEAITDAALVQSRLQTLEDVLSSFGLVAATVADEPLNATDALLQAVSQLQSAQAAEALVAASSNLLQQDQQAYNAAAQNFLQIGGGLYELCIACDGAATPAVLTLQTVPLGFTPMADGDT
jgi:hypothetical protein